jgi:uncharacterized membrane protein YfcA
MIYLAIPLMGLFISIVSVFIGLGGGIILVPLLPEVFGLSVHEAVATSLLTIVFVVSENTYKFHKRDLVNWSTVLAMGPTSALAAIVAAQWALRVEPRIILLALLILLGLVALKTLLSSFLERNYQARTELSLKARILAALGGALAGITSGFAGVGAGVILSPLMIYLKAVTPAQLSPTANANMVFTTLAASASFIYSGELVRWNQWGLIRWDLAVGVFMSASFFSRFLRPHQNKLPFRVKSLILGLLLCFLIYKIANKL